MDKINNQTKKSDYLSQLAKSQKSYETFIKLPQH